MLEEAAVEAGAPAAPAPGEEVAKAPAEGAPEPAAAGAEAATAAPGGDKEGTAAAGDEPLKDQDAGPDVHSEANKATADAAAAAAATQTGRIS